MPLVDNLRPFVYSKGIIIIWGFAYAQTVFIGPGVAAPGGLLRGLGSLGLLRRLGALLLCRSGGGFCLGCLLGGNGKHLLQRSDLIMLGHIVKYHIQLRFRQHLGIGLGLFAVLGDDLPDLLGCHAEIRRDLLQTILH